MFFFALLSAVVVVLIFLLSRRLYQQIFSFFYLLIKNKNWAIKLLVMILLPGTIVHELSHFLTAAVLGVRVGTICLFPKIKESGKVIAGETQIAQCDPIRYSIIGLAPFFIGMIIIYSISKLLFFKSINFVGAYLPPLNQVWDILTSFDIVAVFFILLLFWVSNTMFSSKKDLQMIAIPLVFLYIIGFVLYFAGFRLTVSVAWLQSLDLFFKELSFYLLFALFINLFFWLVIQVFNSLLMIVLGKKRII